MTKSVEEQVQAMLKEIQAGREDPLEGSNHHTPMPDTPEENTLPTAEDTEPVHVFFVRESEVQQALVDAKTVEAEAGIPTPSQSVTSRKTVTRNNAVLSVGIFTICVLISILLLLLFIVPQLVASSATITIIPVERSITTTKAIKVHGRVLPALTLSQSITTPATGIRRQAATEAHGSITFFNGLYISQTVASGTVLTGQDGVHVITDQPAVIPAANPPGLGQTTISAHTIDTGAQGNIPAGDINQQCCLTAVKAVNTEAFTGGQNSREYLVVTTSDLARPEKAIRTTLHTSEQAALEAQAHAGEALTPPLCSEKETSDHRIGEEATNVTVTVYETCSGIAYNAHDVYQNGMQLLTREAVKRLGTGFLPMGDVTVHLLHVTIVDTMHGIAAIAVKLDAIYAYQLSPGEKQQLVHLIAGKPKQQAIQALLRVAGIQGVRITGTTATLPTDISRITLVLLYRSA